MTSEFGYHPRTKVEKREAQMFLESAISFAVEAGNVIRPFFRNDTLAHDKGKDGRFDPVTEADRAAEETIRQRIFERYPTHGIFGEEHGIKSGSGLTWVVDPIDGTRSFISGMLHWGVLIALFDGEAPRLGVMYQPFTEELFVGTNDGAEYRRGSERRRLRVRSCERLEQAVLASTGPDGFLEGQERDSFERVSARARLTRFGGDCYLYCMLAMGQIDLAVEAGLKPYDIQALMPIIRGAGGIVTTWDGGDPSMGGRIVAAGDARVHTEARAVLGQLT
jgi:myo-inositol-1(or 4)-monophosphatase